MQKKQNKPFYASTPKKQKSAKRNPENELTGIYKQMQGFGFVDRIDEKTGKKEGFFVHESKKLDALEGDEVAFEIQYFQNRPEAIIKKVLRRSEGLVVGMLKVGKTFAFVLPKNKKIGKDIFIPGKYMEGYRDGALVAVQILKWEGKNPEGRIMELLDNIPEGRRDIYEIAFEMGARKSFSQKVKAEVAKLQSPDSRESGLEGREDFRKLLTYTIDGAESKDLDDAISIEVIYEKNSHTITSSQPSPLREKEQASNIQQNVALLSSKGEEIQRGGSYEGEQRMVGNKKIIGYRLFVHIADVSHFVQEDSDLDREARKRATSIYLVDQVIPMLPAELSNGLCSLHPGEDKLTLTCVMDINLEGKVTHAKVCESVIQSDFRLTYREIDEISANFSTQQTSSQPSPLGEKEQAPSDTYGPLLSFKGEEIQRGGQEGEGISIGDSLQFGGILSEELFKNLTILKELSDILEKNAEKRGSLDFDFPETKIVLDEAGNPREYKKYERYDSYKIIEVCMVLANESVAKLFSKYPFLYRIHEKPDEEDVERFMKLYESLITPPSASQVSPSSEGDTSHASLGGGRWLSRSEAGGSIIPKTFQKILESLKANPRLEKFQKLLLRSMAKAKYSEKNLGHFGLALDFYSHFTSPIRRYPDLQIHRIIKEILAKKITHERKKQYQEILPKVARICSEKSDKAEKMEYRVRDMLACKYMSDKIGQQFTGKISGMIEKGFFVELENTIEGFIEFGLTGYQFDSEKFVIFTSKGEEKHFGDEVFVKVLHVDMEKYRIEFELV